MPREAPSWVRKLTAARAAALAQMTPEEVEARAIDAAARAGRRAKRIADAWLMNQHAMSGDTPDEIAVVLGITPRRVVERAKRWGMVLPRRRGFRWLAAWVSDHRLPALDLLAADMGVTRSVALEKLLDAALEEGAIPARRILGVKRQIGVAA